MDAKEPYDGDKLSDLSKLELARSGNVDLLVLVELVGCWTVLEDGAIVVDVGGDSKV